MNIQNFLVDAGKHSRDMTQIPRLSQADRAKFSRTELSGIVHDNVLLGRINVCEAILRSHRANPYGTVDELIGDLQILLVESNDRLMVSNGCHKLKVNINDLVQ